MEQVIGKYQYVSTENAEEFVKSIGKSDLTQTFLQSAPLVEIKVNGDQWKVTISSKDKSVTSTFKLGELYDERFPSMKMPFKVNVRTECHLNNQGESKEKILKALS